MSLVSPAVDAHLDRILAVVRHGLTGTDTSEEVARSWSRCINDYRLDPTVVRVPPILTGSEFRQRCERSEDLIDCAKLEMTSLYQQLNDQDCAVVLAGADGVILHMVSSPVFAQDVAGVGFRVGAVWSEREAGTNGMGTCVEIGGPVAVCRTDHFYAQYSSLTCSAVPVYDHNGALAAVLDVTSRSKLLQQHSLVLLGMTAQQIENRLFDARFREAYPVHFHCRPEFVYTLHAGKLLVDAGGVVLAANRSALFQLGVRSVEGVRARRISDLLKTSLESLLARSIASSFHPVPVYGARTSNRFFAVAQQPAATLLRHLPARSAGLAVARTTSGEPAAPELEFGDPQVTHQLTLARRVIARRIPVLLHGETGVGKEVFAHALHRGSPYSAGNFVAVNCASLPESLIESELFGYRAGAFTGAQRGGRRGKILQADKGTLFLDEIGDMPLALQARLLRVLDTRRVTPLGAEESIEVDFQLVSATHRDLEERVRSGLFREDLYFRLNGVSITLPPLRERPDKTALIQRILAEEGARFSLTAEAEAVLLEYPWPGNVRQLRHVLRTLAALYDGDTVTREQLLAQLPKVVAPEPPTDEEPKADVAAHLPLNPIQATERQALLRMLEDHRWNVSNVAKALKLSRNTLYRKFHKLHIELSHVKRSG